MSITLNQILALVGTLDDSAGENTPRERFRHFLQENVSEVGQIRDYIEECLRTSGDQYARALQDLVNHLGRFLGFEVTFGRYQGAQGKIGFDGRWGSPTGFHLVVEVKTTEVYAIKTATLLNYINELLSQKAIRDPDMALGLYVVGRRDPELRQLENAILGERKTQQLRIISAGSLISLAEMMNEYDIAHEDVLALIRPSAPTIDPVVDLMARLVAGPKPAGEAKAEMPLKAQGATQAAREAPEVTPAPVPKSEVAYWLTPVKGGKEQTADECIRKLVGKEHIYAFGENTPGRKRIKPGDWICFYANAIGVIAHAKVVSYPERTPHKAVQDPDRYPWTFRLSNPVLYLNNPVVIDPALRARLRAFQRKDPTKSWAWFVQGTGAVDEHDFRVLTRTSGMNRVG